MEKNAVAHFDHQPSGCYWYRIKRPMDVLRKSGIRVETIKLNTDVNLDDVNSVQVYGIYPFSFDKALKSLKDDGKNIVYDLDDALDLIDESNPFYYNVMKDRGSEAEIFKYADHITAATDGIKEYVKSKTLAPITVVPNTFDPDEWTYPRPKREGIRIGFSGSSTHIDDLLIILPSIKNLQKKYHIRFLIHGFGKMSYSEWLTSFKFTAPPKGLRAITEFEKLMSEIKFEWIPYVDFWDFPATLTNMALDIGLCPVKDTPFNRCRSTSKAMEYELSGALAMASNTITYQRDPTSILVDDGNWTDALEYFINNPTKLREEHHKHLDWIHKNRNMYNQTDILKSIYL